MGRGVEEMMRKLMRKEIREVMKEIKEVMKEIKEGDKGSEGLERGG